MRTHRRWPGPGALSDCWHDCRPCHLPQIHSLPTGSGIPKLITLPCLTNFTCKVSPNQPTLGPDRAFERSVTAELLYPCVLPQILTSSCCQSAPLTPLHCQKPQAEAHNRYYYAAKMLIAFKLDQF